MRRRDVAQMGDDAATEHAARGAGAASPRHDAGAKAARGGAAGEPPAGPWWHVPLLALALIAFTWATAPDASSALSVWHVWWYGWVTAVSTGFGVLPFVFMTKVDGIYLGCSNAVAAGMMVAASATLAYEGVALAPLPGAAMSESGRVLLGMALGVAFIVVTKRVLDQYEDLTLGNLGVVDSRKALLIMGVMTLHSFSEGVGIGTAFGGASGASLGVFISASLAVHNVPEGLAVALVLAPRGVSTLHTVAWAIFSSLPQPLCAVPAFLFVEQFYAVLPVGLGFAAGAMAYVAVTELFLDAIEHVSRPVALTCVTAAGTGMLWLNYTMK